MSYLKVAGRVGDGRVRVADTKVKWAVQYFAQRSRIRVRLQEKAYHAPVKDCRKGWCNQEDTILTLTYKFIYWPHKKEKTVPKEEHWAER
jgi:hypothetical protein